MRLVCVHADSARFEAGADSRAGGNGDLWQRSADISEPCLVVFATVEDGDRRDEPVLVANAVDEITATAAQLGVDQILVAPSAHLSSTPATPAVVPELIAAVAEGVRTGADEAAVICVPPDDKTRVEIAAKGHPHARQSTRVWPYADRDTDTGDREWTVAFPDGLTQSVDTVETGARAVGQAMQGLLAHLTASEWRGIDWAPVGTNHAGMSPTRATFLRDGIAEFVRTAAVEAGAVPVETGGAAGTQRRQRVRPSSGLPRALSPAVASGLAAESQRPGRCYRLGTAPRPRAGETETLPSRTTPELWALTGDTEQALAEFERQVRLVGQVADGLGLPSAPLLRVSQQGWARRRTWIERLVAGLDEPVLVERGGPRSDPWDIELTRVSPVDDQPIRLGAVGVGLQGLAGVETSGAERPERASPAGGPLVCAALLCSLEGAVDATGVRARERDPPRLPAWLAPEQVRLVPTDPAAYTEACDSFADETEAGGVGIRVGIDARERSVGERLEAAAAALVPYVAVVGRPEAGGKPLSVTDRAARTELDLTPAALGERLQADLDGWPRKPRYLSRQVSTRT
jgi:threonyl-tRNA synthetase